MIEHGSHRWLGVPLTLLAASSALATATPDTVYTHIIEMDRMLFDAFNSCDLETFERVMALDLEFYDDRSGLNTDRELEIASFVDRCRTGTSALRRELDLASVEIHALGTTHAVQMGIHRFYAHDEGGEEQLVAAPRFIHIWDLRGELPRVSRVVSYEH